MHKNFTHNVKVYYEDTDAGGVVYYANYLKYLERARTEALSNIGLSNTKIKNDFGALIIVKSCNIEYKKPACLEDDLQIKSFVESTSKTSFLMIRRPPRSTPSNSSAASDVYKRQRVLC